MLKLRNGMKNLFNILKPLLAGMVVVACGTDLDIQPTQNIDATQSLLTSKDVKGTLVGAYSNLGSSNLYGGGVYVYADLLASSGTDINFFGTFQGLTQISNKEIPINNGFTTGLWVDAYTAINTANEVIAAIDLVNPTDQDRVEGEAKFIRGSMYFELVKIFAKAWNDGDPTTNPGVPLVLTPTHSLKDALKTPARSSVSQVYAQIISDLTDAKNLLSTPDNVTYYYATTGAASAQMSRVYLLQGDYTNARNEANTVIQSGFYQLVANYADEFPYQGKGSRVYNTTEDIFALQVSEQQGFNNMNNYYASSDKGGRGDIEVPQDFYDRFELGDTRAGMLNNDGSGYYYSKKFDNVYGNVKIFRLAEMYLTRAECNVRLGGSLGDTPENDVNLIRARAGLAPIGGLVTLDQVLNERFLELAFEGQWLYDYKRTNTSNPNWVDAAGNTPTWDSPEFVFPIPQREIQVNPNLVQNAGYQ
jgi:hypothetical protein